MERGVRFERLMESAEASREIVGGFWGPVREWWTGRFSGLSLPQRLAVPAIAAGKHTLVCAPTGTGKTLCAFISIVSNLFERQAAGTLIDGVDTVYVSPLRALGTDVTKNLLVPLREIAAAMGWADLDSLPIRVGQRTGDTTPKERAAMVKRPPHILVTTPESLGVVPGQRRHAGAFARRAADHY